MAERDDRSGNGPERSSEGGETSLAGGEQQRMEGRKTGCQWKDEQPLRRWHPPSTFKGEGRAVEAVITALSHTHRRSAAAALQTAVRDRERHEAQRREDGDQAEKSRVR